MSRRRILLLGPQAGWHAQRLSDAAKRLGHQIRVAPYESLAGRIEPGGSSNVSCAAGPLASFDLVFCRTMPAGSLEQISFRLAALHAAVASGLPVINPPRTLELAIDKYATLAIVAKLGYRVPQTVVVQSRSEALAAFETLGGDVIVKPIFGGEGRGVMRVSDRQLAWTCFSTLERLGAVLYLQRFVPPGGRDTRLLVIGQQVFALRRVNDTDFRTNVASGGRCEAATVEPALERLAQRIAAQIGLTIGSVDLLDCHAHGPVVVEVNAVPGWQAAQACLPIDLAEAMIRCLTCEETQ